MSREIITKLEVFIKDKALLANLRQLPAHDRISTQHFIIEVSRALTQYSARAWNNWNYIDHVLPAFMMSGSIIAMNTGYFPTLIYIGAASVGFSFLFIGAFHQWSHNQLTWYGMEDIERDLLERLSYAGAPVWQHFRLQMEIIFRCNAIQMDAKKIKELERYIIDPNQKTTSNKKVSDFIRAVNHLFPGFVKQLNRTTLICRVLINGSAIMCLSFGCFLYQIRFISYEAVGLFLPVFFILTFSLIREGALKMSYGGNLIALWNVHRVKKILAILEQDYEINNQLTLERPLEIPTRKLVKKLEYSTANRKSKSCRDRLIQNVALLMNIAKAVTLFGFQILTKPFRSKPKIDKYTEAEIYEKKLNARPILHSVIRTNHSPAKKQTSGKRKNDTSLLTSRNDQQQQPGNTATMPRIRLLANGSVIVHEGALLLEPESKLSPKLDDEIHMDYTDSSTTSETASCSAVNDDATAQPTESLTTLPQSEPKQVEENKAEPKEVTLTLKIPEFFGGKEFQVTLSTKDAPRWGALQLTEQEKLAIYEVSHPAICQRASRHASESWGLFRSLKKLQDQVASSYKQELSS